MTPKCMNKQCKKLAQRRNSKILIVVFYVFVFLIIAALSDIICTFNLTHGFLVFTVLYGVKPMVGSGVDQVVSTVIRVWSSGVFSELFGLFYYMFISSKELYGLLEWLVLGDYLKVTTSLSRVKDRNMG